MKTETKEQRGFKNFKMPHVYVILISIIVVCTVLTYVIPAGQYSTIKEGGRDVIDASSFKYIENTPLNFMEMLSSIPKGMVEAAEIIFFIFIIGGAFGIIEATGAIHAAIGKITKTMKGKERLIIPIVMIFFALGGSIIGLSEESLAFIPIMVSLAIALGFDSITGVAMVLVGAGAGFSGAFMNPFTVGVAQGIAGLPLFSAMTFRLVLFTAMTSLSIGFVYYYSGKIKNDPTKSLVYDIDCAREELTDINEFKDFGKQEKAVFIIFLATIVILIYGVLTWKWYLMEISGLFIGMAIVVALVSGMGFNGFAEELAKGMGSIASGALVVGFARGILVVLNDGNILHTILNFSAGILGQLSSTVTALGIYIFQCLLNFLIPSGSGQAAVSLPVICPLADMVGVTRQTAVVAYQLGDGISNIFTPTSGYFMAGLALAKVPWIKWAKWILPLILLQYALGAVFVLAAQIMQLGPF